MAGENSAAAYYITIKKDKRLKGFYWMVNAKNAYSLLNTVITNNGMNMLADKAPSVESTAEIRAFMETTVAAYKAELPGLEQPLRAVEMVDVVRDLTDRDLVRKDTLGVTLKKQLEESSAEFPKRSGRLSAAKLEKNKGIKEKKGAGPSEPQQNEGGEGGEKEESGTQVLDRLNFIFQNSPRLTEEVEGSGEDEEGHEENGQRLYTEDEDQEEGEDKRGDTEGEGFPPAKKSRMQRQEVGEGLTVDNVTGILRKMNNKCESNLVEVMQDLARETQDNVDKVYEQARQGTRETKLAIANCYEAIQQGQKLATVTEHNVKELVKAQKLTNKLLTELGEKMDRMDRGKDKGTEQGFKPFYKKYCAYCKEGTHDIEECKVKVTCFRCGEYNHKEVNCYWMERSCGRCHARGHKREMHDTKDTEMRELLVGNFPKSFTHFVTDPAGGNYRGGHEDAKNNQAERGRHGGRGKGADSRRYNR